MVAVRSEGESSSTSLSLIRRVREQDPAAWERLVQIYGPLVYLWSRKLNVPPHEVDDISQETFLAVRRFLNKFRRERPSDSFRAWLFTVTRNMAHSYHRNNGRVPTGVGGSDFQQQLANLADVNDDGTVYEWDELVLTEDDRVREVHLVMEQIRSEYSEQNWNAFLWTVVEQRPSAEVAEELNMTAGAIRQARYRILRRLRRELDELQEP